MQRDAEYAQSLVAAEAGNNRQTRATSDQQQLSSINDREHLQTMLDIVAPPSVIEDSEEDDQPIKLNQLEELEEVIHGQPYQPDQYSQPTSLSMDQHQRGHQMKCLVRTLIDSPHLIKQRLSLPDQTSAKNGK